MIMLETGDTGKAVSAESDGALYSAIIGSESYVLNVGKKFTAEIQSNNKIKINDGSALVNGRHVRIASGDSELITINNGSHGLNRKDIIVIRYQKEPTGIESVKFLVIQGEETSLEAKVPSYTKGNILTGSTVVDFPLYEVSLTGINITEIKKLFEVIGTNEDLTDKVTELNGKIPFSTVLYDNTSGTKTDATLSDNVTNYEYVEIFYGNDLNDNDAYVPMRSIKTILKDGYARARLLWFGSASDSANHQFSRLALELHDNTIHFGGENFVNFSSTAGSVKWSNASTRHFKIFRVIGWKH